MEKECKACGVTKELTQFGPTKMNKDGREGKCRECRQTSKKTHDCICSNCEKVFKSAKKATKFCGADCAGLARRKRVNVICSNCESPVEIIASKYGKHDDYYCNQNCRTEHLKTTMVGTGNPNYNRVDHKCSGCSVIFKEVPNKVNSGRLVFCTFTCYKKNVGGFFKGENNPNYVPEEIKECYKCLKSFSRKPGVFNRHARHFCSKECYRSSMKVIRSKFKVARVTIPCATCGENVSKLPSQITGKKNVFCSTECRHKGISIFQSGENHFRWNPELTEEERVAERSSTGYQAWRNKVYKRDNYTCQICADSSGGNLNAHHLNSYHWNVEGRQDVDNGITLCVPCHTDFHKTYSYSYSTAEQFEEYKRNKELTKGA